MSGSEAEKNAAQMEQQAQEPQREPAPAPGAPEPLEIESVMCIVAHPDDAEFSSAGTLAKFAKEGKRVYIVVCTAGNKGSPDPNMKDEDLAAMREKEQLAASAELGITETIFLRNPDGELYPTLDFRKQVVEQLRRYRPDVVITHDPWRPYALHPDHRAVGITVADAVYPTARDAIYFPEHYQAGLQPWKVGEIWFYGSEKPDRYIDISETFQHKIAALRHHDSQVGRSTQLEDRIRERVTEVGKEAGLPMAEAFKVLRMRR
jgi:LmbE family N-acetylglucosaminyl deacetylase